MKTLIAIMAHLEAKETFERHFPFWQAHEKEGAELIFCFPADASFKVPGYQSLAIGPKEHHGYHAIIRFFSLMKHLADTGADQFGFLEYDAIVLGALPVLAPEQVMGNRFLDNSPAWKGTQFVHPPIFIGSAAMPKLIQAMEKLSATEERGMWDRWFGLALDQAGLQCQSFLETGLGWAKNTIEPADRPEVRKAVLAGARFLHGIKDKEALDTILLAWHLAEAKRELEKEGVI